MARARLGEILVKSGLLSALQLEAVLKHQRQWGVSLGRAAVAKGFCTHAQVLNALGQQLGMPVVDLDKETMDPALASVIPQRVAEQYNVVPLRVSGARSEVMVVAMAAPATIASQDAVLSLVGKSRLQVFLATDEAVHRGIGRLYRGDSMDFDPSELVVDARSQMLDLDPAEPASPRTPAAPPPAAKSAPPVLADAYSGLVLSANARLVVDHAAKHQGLSPKAVLERIVEGWAERQLRAWAQAKSAGTSGGGAPSKGP